ncbi:MAG TPA: hypothetical protein VFO77_08920 [Actinoplanes sp.]|nr:hypothetical protein [Actinoplanes sp.]
MLMPDNTADGTPAASSPTPPAPAPAAASPAAQAAASPAAPAAASPTGGQPASASRTADIMAGPGGVMTDEVGVVTGELTLRTEFADGQVSLHVQYKDADEWYAVTGGRAPLADPAGLDAVHTVAVALLHRPEE